MYSYWPRNLTPESYCFSDTGHWCDCDNEIRHPSSACPQRLDTTRYDTDTWFAVHHLGLYSVSGKTSYRQISRSLEAARSAAIMILSLLNLTGISAELLTWCLSNFKVIGKVLARISRLRDFTRSFGKASVRLVNRDPELYKPFSITVTS